MPADCVQKIHWLCSVALGAKLLETLADSVYYRHYGATGGGKGILFVALAMSKTSDAMFLGCLLVLYVLVGCACAGEWELHAPLSATGALGGH